MDLGTPWWRIIGSFLLVAGVLVLCLRLLATMQGRRAPGDIRLVDVASLGPKRAVERLRYKDEELLIYRSEGAMLLVDRRPAPAESESGTSVQPTGPGEILKKWIGRG